MKIDLIDISLEYDNKLVLDNLNLTFKEKELSCLLGQSGSGKTSLLKIIAGILPKFKGSVILDGADCTNISPKARNIGWVPQQQLLFPGLNVKDNIAYGLIARKIPKEIREKRIIEVTKLVGLSGIIDRSPRGLSGGERQRVALARALAPSPRCLLLDEPFSSLDAPERDRLALLFKEIQLTTGVTTIHVTHSPHEADLISDKVFVLANGKIAQQGPIEQLYSQPKNINVAKLLNIPNVIERGTFETINSDIIIPLDAIKLNNGEFLAKVVAITKQSIHLVVMKNIPIKIDNQNKLKLKPGDKITIGFDPSKFLKF